MSSQFIFGNYRDCFATTDQWLKEGFGLQEVKNLTIEDATYRCRVYSKQVREGDAVGEVAAKCYTKQIREAIYPVPVETTSVSCDFPSDYGLGSVNSIEISSVTSSSLGSELCQEIEETTRNTPIADLDVSVNPLERDPKLISLIQKDSETNHSFILEAGTKDRSSFIFIPNGDQTKAERIIVAYSETGKPVRNPLDLKQMVMCYCSLYDSAKEDWEKRHIPLIAAKLGCITYRVTYSLMVVNFSQKTVLVFSNPHKLCGFSNFRGTKLKIERSAQERIQKIVRNRMESEAKEKGLIKKTTEEEEAES